MSWMTFTCLSCFFCGVDTRVLTYFLISFVASLVAGTAAFLFWSVAKGDFQDIEGPKYEMLDDADINQEDRNGG